MCSFNQQILNNWQVLCQVLGTQWQPRKPAHSSCLHESLCNAPRRANVPVSPTLSLFHKKLRFSLNFIQQKIYPRTMAAGLKCFHAGGKHVAVAEMNPIFKDRIWLGAPHSFCSLSLVLVGVPSSGTLSSLLLSEEHTDNPSPVRWGLPGGGPRLGESPRMHLVWADIPLMPSRWPGH